MKTLSEFLRGFAKTLTHDDARRLIELAAVEIRPKDPSDFLDTPVPELLKELDQNLALFLGKPEGTDE